MTKSTDQTSRRGLSRRQILKATAGTAALLAAAKLNFPAGAFAQGAGPETKAAKLGFIALSDAGPLFVAKDKGFFAKHGMPDVDVQKQASWGTTRDNLVLGSEGNGIDGAHILTPMPYLISAGKVTQNNVPTPMYILARLNLDAQCISVAKEYADLKLGVDTAPFKVALDKKKASGKSIKAAMTFPGGTHDLWIRYWLAAGGIDPDKDIETIVVPPPQMVANMKVGTMEASAWASRGTCSSSIRTSATPRSPPASSGTSIRRKPSRMRADWVDKNPKAAQALHHGGPGGAAVVRQSPRTTRRARDHHRQAGVDQLPRRGHPGSHAGPFNYGTGRVVENSPHHHEVLARPRLLSVPEPRPLVPHRGSSLGQIRTGEFDSKALIAKVNRADIWRDAAEALGVAASDIPASTSRGEETSSTARSSIRKIRRRI